MADPKKDNLKNLILAILLRCREIPKVKLAKLILFSEIEHFQRTGKSITGLYFVRLKNGPVIAFFDEVLASGKTVYWEKQTKQIHIMEEGREKTQYLYKPITKSAFPSELEKTVKKTCGKYGKMTGSNLSLESHNLIAWKYSEPNEPIYLAELAVKNEQEYFALTDLIEDIDEEDNDLLGKKISQSISRA